MAKAVIIEEFGGPRNMKLVEVAVGEPGPGEVRIRQEAIGLNFIDVYYRTGVYPMALPGGLGMGKASSTWARSTVRGGLPSRGRI